MSSLAETAPETAISSLEEPLLEVSGAGGSEDSPTTKKSSNPALDDDACCIDGISACCARLSVDSSTGLKTLTTLAVIRPDNTTVDVFDTKGRVQTFRTLSSLMTINFDDDGEHLGRDEIQTNEEKETTASLPITESLPKQCTSNQLRSHLTEGGYSMNQWLHRRKYTCIKRCGSHHQIYSVKHGDHTDNLVHNVFTNELHLEHHDLTDCEDIDIHGHFNLVSVRSWVDDGVDSGGAIIHENQCNKDSLIGPCTSVSEKLDNKQQIDPKVDTKSQIHHGKPWNRPEK